VLVFGIGIGECVYVLCVDVKLILNTHPDLDPDDHDHALSEREDHVEGAFAFNI
jgi:hypothetical protein